MLGNPANTEGDPTPVPCPLYPRADLETSREPTRRHSPRVCPRTQVGSRSEITARERGRRAARSEQTQGHTRRGQEPSSSLDSGTPPGPPQRPGASAALTPSPSSQAGARHRPAAPPSAGIPRLRGGDRHGGRGLSSRDTRGTEEQVGPTVLGRDLGAMRQQQEKEGTAAHTGSPRGHRAPRRVGPGPTGQEALPRTAGGLVPSVMLQGDGHGHGALADGPSGPLGSKVRVREQHHRSAPAPRHPWTPATGWPKPGPRPVHPSLLLSAWRGGPRHEGPARTAALTVSRIGKQGPHVPGVQRAAAALDEAPSQHSGSGPAAPPAGTQATRSPHGAPRASGAVGGHHSGLTWSRCGSGASAPGRAASQRTVSKHLPQPHGESSG